MSGLFQTPPVNVPEFNSFYEVAVFAMSNFVVVLFMLVSFLLFRGRQKLRLTLLQEKSESDMQKAVANVLGMTSTQLQNRLSVIDILQDEVRELTKVNVTLQSDLKITNYKLKTALAKIDGLQRDVHSRDVINRHLLTQIKDLNYQISAKDRKIAQLELQLAEKNVL